VTLLWQMSDMLDRYFVIVCVIIPIVGVREGGKKLQWWKWNMKIRNCKMYLEGHIQRPPLGPSC